MSALQGGVCHQEWEVSLGSSPWQLPLPACGERVGVRGRCRGRCGEDCIPNPFDVLQDFIVPETEDTVAVRCEPSIAYRIGAVFGVLAAIDLDHEPLLSTNKIDDIRPDRSLTHEFEPSKRSGTQVLPKPLFSSRRISPQSSRPQCLRYLGAAHASRPPHPTLSPHAGRGSPPRRF
jgi:hypothetical protein